VSADRCARTPSDARELGETIEDAVCDDVGPLDPVSDAEAEWHDARAGEQITTDDVELLGRLAVDAGTPVEIKGAQVEISDGTRMRAGRWYLKRDSHRRLLEADGVYALTIHSGGVPSRIALAPAAVLDERIGSWTSTDRSHAPVAKIAWTRVLDRGDLA
jgi:hypothetical protein